MPPVLERNGEVLELSLSNCRGWEFEEAKAKIRDVPGRQWDPDKKVWRVPAEVAVAERILKTIRPEMADNTIVDWVRESKSSQEETLTTPLPADADLLVPWATKRAPWQPEVVNDEKVVGLLPYQRAAVDAIAKANRMLLCDDMGLGKTFMAISAVEEWRLRQPSDGQTVVDGPKLIIAPASVKGGWARELSRWLDEPDVQIIDAKTPAKRHDQLVEAIERAAWVICNWEQIQITKKKVKLKNGGEKTVKVMKEPLFAETEWLAAIGDEIHRAKNREALRTQGLWRVRGQVMIGLTGTPLMNSPDELWAPLAWLWPQEYHERGANFAPGAVAYWPFFDDFVEFWEDPYGRKVITGVKNPDALRFVLKGKLVRRTASILGLKGRKRFFYPVKLNPGQQKLYDSAEKDMWLEVERQVQEGDSSAIKFAQAAVAGESVSSLYRIPNGASRFVRLQQIIENAALLGGDDDSAVMDDFEEKFEASRPSQWVVFCKYKGSCEILAERLRKKFDAEVGVYNGDTHPEDRTKMEDQFQAGELDVIVGTIAAMKEGITLTAGHLMHFLSREVVPDVNEQCEAREDRLGQQEQVRIYIPQAEDTVADGKVHEINRLKEAIVRTVVPKDKIEEALS